MSIRYSRLAISDGGVGVGIGVGMGLGVSAGVGEGRNLCLDMGNKELQLELVVWEVVTEEGL
ncbi:MAG: hypothetical protein QXJ68_07380 [Methanocellales archaeon]